MTEKEFKEHFVTTFLATYCANGYERACATGQVKPLYNPPIEDAVDMADCIWIDYQKIDFRLAKNL